MNDEPDQGGGANMAAQTPLDGRRIAALSGPEVVGFALPGHVGSREVRALLLGSRLDMRSLRDWVDTFDLDSAGGGILFAFRYGAVVFFGVSETTERRMVDRLRGHAIDPLPIPETEATRLIIRHDAEEQIDADGHVILQEATAERLLLVATVLARTVALAHDEVRIAEAFDRIEPLVSALQAHGRAGLPIRRVMRHIGDVLAAQHRLVGRAQISEKPDILWDHPELDRLYARLEAEYELVERAGMIERKLEVLGEAADVLLDLVQDKRSVRLELAIIALITFEILLGLYDRFWT